MTRISATRCISAILAAVALDLCAPAAGARPIDTGPAGSFIAAAPAPRLANSPSAASRTSGSATSDWELVAAGSGAAALGLVAGGATLLATRRRRRRRTAAPPTVAA
ncbi:MAG: hypothetical protein JO304_27960 [Solirubrobacterales bacterium]|nr:hypothetical protein [Solirubrobacterales bacterium]